MAFDQPTRHRLATFVKKARDLITDEFTQKFAERFGIADDGTCAPLEKLTHLDEPGLATAALLRQRIDYLVNSHPEERAGRAAAVKRLAREQAFTVLNRLAALRMAEKRQLILESVGKGYQSKGYKLYATVAGTGLGETYERYRRYLFCLCDELAVDLGALFDRHSPHGILFPREPALLGLLDLLNAADLEHLWAEDETIGWIYQYYNGGEVAEMRKAVNGGPPRNSRELAVRNQFFTPRYVVEFLTDNTLGRIWYEMTQGETTLRERCRYLVRRPNEIFLKAGEAAPEAASTDGLSQEELLRAPIHIPHRPLKDPRELRMLDPACGSMHFGLYAFDLYEVIYAEAWDRGCDTLKVDFPDRAGLLREVPRLVVENNIHGVDIDPRAAQIAALSLWLRAQKSWSQQGLAAAARPRISRSHIVCAEPMPGDKALLADFVERAFPAAERPVFQHLLDRIFDHMQLAGEAGSLLKIEEEIRTAIEEAKALSEKSRTVSRELFSTDIINTTLRPGAQQELGGLESAVSQLGAKADFWESAEERIYQALRGYSEQAETTGSVQRRLFANDAAQGFAFIDLCRKRYDVALMNPPFGDASLPSKAYIDDTYGDTKGDVYKAFVECFHARLIPAGYLGIISSRTGFFLGQSEDWRTRVVLRLFRPIALADLGMGVLDAMVEVAAYVLRSLSESEARDLTLSIVPALGKVARDSQDRFSLPKWQAARDGLKRHQAIAELEHLAAQGFIQRSPGEIVRYSPLWHSVKNVAAPPAPLFPPLVCFRALAEGDKGSVLESAIRNPGDGRAFVSNPGLFSEVPGSPFAYWAGDTVRQLFTNLPAFEGGGRMVRAGGQTSDDFRYLRAFWECLDRPSVGTWRTYVKGGAYSPFYNDLPLLAHWHDEHQTFAGFLGRPGRNSAQPSNYELYFRPGITWPLRAKAFSPQVMPSGSIFTVRGYAILAPVAKLPPLLGLSASSVFDYIFKLLLGRFGFPEFVVGVLQKLPTPSLENETGTAFGKLGLRAWHEKRSLKTAESTSHAFHVPALVRTPGSKLAERADSWAARVRASEETVYAIQAEIDDLAFRLYGLAAADRAALTCTLATEGSGDAEASEDADDAASTADIAALTADLLAYALGCAVGRWDIRYATGDRPAPPVPDPFSPLPVCPPGQLQNVQGLPVRPEDVLTAYPIDIPWGGILVDDPEHPLDLVSRVQAALAVIWKERAEAIEHEACELLGVASLRDWFRRPPGFFADHLRRYSKSSRQAPIYWPLSTKSGGYTLWIYYHRLTDQTLHTAIADFVEPKIKAVEATVASARAANRTHDLAEAQEFLDELRDFKAEVERLTKLPWRPNLNDGVLITASPLWKLFRLPKWQKDLKACWEELERGDYDWAHLAHTLRPKEVEEKCKTDRSLAIAHGLEHLCQIEPPKPKAKRGKKTKTAEQPELSEETE